LAAGHRFRIRRYNFASSLGVLRSFVDIQVTDRKDVDIQITDRQDVDIQITDRQDVDIQNYRP
jgi:hypothetical protein